MSHLSAQVVSRLLRENRKSIQKKTFNDIYIYFFFINVTLQILNFILVS